MELAILKEKLGRRQLREVEWFDAKGRIADGLTKRGASTEMLRGALKLGKFLMMYKCTRTDYKGRSLEYTITSRSSQFTEKFVFCTVGISIYLFDS